jgi:hypothetical protein
MLIASDMIRYAMTSARPKRFQDGGGSSLMTQLLIAILYGADVSVSTNDAAYG